MDTFSRLMLRLLGRSPLAPPAPPRVRSRADFVAEVLRCDSLEQLAGYLHAPDGHVREAAVLRTVELGASALLPALAVRLNDWVAPVRNKARNAVLTLLATLDPGNDIDIAMQLLLAVQHLREARRLDHADWITLFERAFIDLLGVPRILNGIGAGQPHIAQACFTLAWDHRLATPSSLCRHALATKGNIVLVRRALDIATDLDDVDRLAIYRQALNARVGIARATALRALLRTEAGDSVDLAMPMLVDGNAWVRLIAITHCAKLGVDVPAQYAERIGALDTTMRTVRACLAGLAESGGRAHLDLVRTLTQHRQGRVQAAAYMAWMHLSPAEKDEIALAVLHSPHRRVRALFIVFARTLGACVPLDTALPLMREHGDHDQMLALAQGLPWTMLEVIATVAADIGDDPAFRHRLRQELFDSLGAADRGYTQPTARQHDFLCQATVQQTLLGLVDSEHARRKVVFEFQMRQAPPVKGRKSA
jgi:hypothetical protein